MKQKAVKVGLTSLVLAAAFGGLLFTTLGEATEYYKLVDEVMVNPQPWYGKKLQLHGFAKEVSRKPNSLEYRFVVESNGQRFLFLPRPPRPPRAAEPRRAP